MPRTFSATASLTPPSPRSERDAVAIETPAASATSDSRTAADGADMYALSPHRSG